MIGFGVLQLLHHPDLRIRSGAVSRVVADLIGGIVAVLLDLRAIVNVKALRLYAGGADKLDLLGFIVVQGGRALEGLEVKFVEGLLADDRRGGSHVRGFGLETIGISTDRPLEFAYVSSHTPDALVFERLANVDLHCDLIDAYEWSS